jgi:hypothetical protein
LWRIQEGGKRRSGHQRGSQEYLKPSFSHLVLGPSKMMTIRFVSAGVEYQQLARRWPEFSEKVGEGAHVILTQSLMRGDAPKLMKKLSH